MIEKKFVRPIPPPKKKQVWQAENVLNSNTKPLVTCSKGIHIPFIILDGTIRFFRKNLKGLGLIHLITLQN